MPTFLLKGVCSDPRIKNRIKINIDEVVKIPEILACDRIAGLVRKGHCIEESVQRAFHELDKWFFHRVLARAAKHSVLENVDDAGRITRRRAKSDAEHLVLVVIDEREQLGARFGVT